ncbi:MAG: hypothetical protein HY840_12855 [Bacteroidetes bacterium]|nr:hypothetical protein [Bacteroidota bacterium]
MKAKGIKTAPLSLIFCILADHLKNVTGSIITSIVKYFCFIIVVIISTITVPHHSNATVNDTRYYIELRGKIKRHLYNHKLHENIVDSALILISNATKEVTKTCYSDQSGRCQFKLPMNEQFEIQISKKGYVAKIINVDTRIPEKKFSVYTLIFDIYLFEDIQGLDVSMLKSPIAKVIFNNDSNSFVYDHLYTYKINEKMKKIYRDYYRQYMISSKNIPNNPPQEYVVFQIQLMALNNRLPLKSSLFSECGRVNECYINGLYKYTVGEFRSLSHAKSVLSGIMFLGFTDAFIVAVKGKERIPISKALTLLNQ